MDINSLFRGIPIRGGKFSQERILKYIKFFLLAAIAIVLLLLVRDAISLWYGSKGQVSPQGQKAAATPVSRQSHKKPLNAYASVVEKNVFGIDGAKFKVLSGAASSSKTAQVPSQLAFLKLMGTVAWPNGFGYAFIAGREGDQQVYKTGEDIEGAGKLKTVKSKSIIIDASGSDVELPLQEIGGKEAQTQVRHNNGAPSHQSTKRIPADFARQTSDTSYVVDQKAVQESIDNPENIMTDARLIPNMANGKQNGFVIREVKNPGIYHSLGLKNNDILISVNEFKLSNPQAALQAFSALKGMDHIELNIIRDGNPMTLTYSLR